MFKKSPLKSAKLVKKKRKLLFLKIFGIVFLVSAVLALFIFLFHLKLFAINAVVVEGNKVVDAEMIKNIATTELEGKYYKLFPRSNRFIYPKKAILADVYNYSLRIKNIALEVKKHDLIISLVEREPSYTWCSGMPKDGQTHTCYFIDETGYIFSESPIFSGNAFFAFYGEVPSEHPLGATYLNAAQFKAIDTLIEFLNSKQLHPFAFYVHDNGVYDLYLEQGGKIIFKEDQDVTLLISNLDLIMAKTQLFSKKPSSLEYIDLRFGNKLFYKIKGDNVVPIEPEPDV